jgi:hypothetical protein
MIKVISSFILFSILTFSSARAAVLVEPLLGYNFAAKVDGPGGNHYSGGNGLGYGGRVGFEKLGFLIAADYLHSNLNMHNSDFSDKLQTNEYGAVVGFRLPILLKFYGGYIINATGTSSYGTGGVASQSAKFSSGHGYKLGVGWTLFPLLDINLEYRNLTFDDLKLGGVKNNRDTNMGAWMVSVSLPIRFLE